jgi:hypothetical protein
MGFRFLSAKSAQAIVNMLAYLTSIIRSQGFSPSQRFEPAWALWFCFAPHPPIGFWPSELFPLSQPQYLSVLDTLLLLDQLQRISGNLKHTFAAVFSYNLWDLPRNPVTFILPLPPLRIMNYIIIITSVANHFGDNERGCSTP